MNQEMSQKSIINQLSDHAKNLGLDLVGCIPLGQGRSIFPTQGEKLKEIEARYDQWLQLGYQGTMTFLESHKSMKFHPESLLPGCTHILVVALNYYQPAPWDSGKPLAQGSLETSDFQTSGRIARYAWGRDYHKILPKQLKTLAGQVFGTPSQGSIWRVLVDANPLDERFFAFNAGLGFTGRHTLTINHDLGSWFFLGTLLLNLQDFPTESPETFTIVDPYAIQGSTGQGSCPKSCFRCLQVCPTGAIKSPHLLDSSRCISYLTIEHKGSIDLDLRPLMGDWIFGCDLCQEVCPFNLKAKITGIQDFLTKKAGPLKDLHQLLQMRTRDDFVHDFAGTPVMRAGRESMVRNAAIAAGNRKNPESVPYLQKALLDPSPVVREHVQWALDQIVNQASYENPK